MIKEETLLFQYEYQSGDIIITAGTCGFYQGELDGKILVRVGNFNVRVPEVYLVSPKDYKELPPQS